MSYGYPTYYPQRPTNQRIWVQGEAGAKSYLVAPNSMVDLWDSEQPVIYMKSADASGVPSMRIIDYTYRDMPVEGDYVTRKELQDFKAYIERLVGEKDEHESNL